MNSNEKIILIITGASHLLVHAVMLILPAILLVLKDEFGVGLATLGVVATASQFMFGLGALPAGYLEKKNWWKKSFIDLSNRCNCIYNNNIVIKFFMDINKRINVAWIIQ